MMTDDLADRAGTDQQHFMTTPISFRSIDRRASDRERRVTDWGAAERHLGWPAPATPV
jgi:5'(3')-deoxyribonucleotidase